MLWGMRAHVKLKETLKLFSFLNLYKVFVNMFKSRSGGHLCRLSERLVTTPDGVKKSRLCHLQLTLPRER